MSLSPTQLHQLETPCIVIDMDIARHNIEKMQRAANQANCALRPHIKTHKMLLFAQMQIAAGAKGITCAKITEAEIMAGGGIDDIFIAYPMVGTQRTQRAIELSKHMRRLILAVDSLAGAELLNQAAKEADTQLEVRLEVDTGAKRTGVLQDQAVLLSKQIASMSNLNLTGIYTFKSLIYDGKPTADNALAAQEEGRLMADIAQNIRAAGINITDISAGSSPTGVDLANTGLVNEIRPGTYVFNDILLYKEGVAAPDEIAAKYYATVVSTPSPEYAIIDGGTKTFPTDIQPGTGPAYANGFAVIEGRTDLALARMNEEHGIITSETGQTNLQVGDVISLLPIHICTAINMHNRVYLLENGKLRPQKVDARGMLL